MSTIIKQLKYRRSSHIIQSLIPLINYTPDFLHNFDYLIPIPLHPKRQKDRGFNQSELLANLIHQHLHTTLAPPILIRTHSTTPQADIHDRNTRLTNLKHVFSLNPNIDKNILKNKSILLIDDVSTTGATLIQATQILKRAHAHIVWGLVLAR